MTRLSTWAQWQDRSRRGGGTPIPTAGSSLTSSDRRQPTVRRATDRTGFTDKPSCDSRQAFLRLSTSGNPPKTGLGRFDLDSTEHHPTPSGTFGRVEVITRESGEDAGGDKGWFGHHRRRTSSTASATSSSGNGGGRTSVDLAGEGKPGEVVEVRYFLTRDVVDVRNEVDDSTKSGNIWLPTKNFSVSSWASCDGARIDLLINKEARYHEHHFHLRQHDPRELRVSHHALDGFGAKTCRFIVSHLGQQVMERWVKINPASGKVDGPRMVSTIASSVVFSPEKNMVVNYGFFDSGMTRAKELYVYTSHYHKRWLGDLISANPRVREVPFTQLALAGAHDAGMLGEIDQKLLNFIHNGDVDIAMPLIAKALPFVQSLLSVLRTFKFETARILENMANTQKDSIKDQLTMGVRFFDFRPGYCLYDAAVGAQGYLHHQHAIVPGMPYVMFLITLLDFLVENPEEIIFFEIKSDDFAIGKTSLNEKTGLPTVLTMIPTLEELGAALEEARTCASTSSARDIVIGNPTDLRRSIGDLIDSNTRLIIADRVHFPDDWERADSYSHEAYDTDEPARVEAALKLTYAAAITRAAKKESPAATIYQLQATPTAQIWADVGASLSFSDASSLLVWSKARMDRVTYKWIDDTTFIEPGNVIFLNDFVDGALVEQALEKSQERCDIWLAKYGSKN
ncbi:hypothetical protein T439DRAFT_39678 [Meredithblackwellia eburnea MCA 4105]